MMDSLRRIACGLLLVAGCSMPTARSGVGALDPVDGALDPVDGALDPVDGALVPGDGALDPGDGALAPGDDAPLDVPGQAHGIPGLGAHALSFYRYHADSPGSIATPPMATHGSGSLIIAGIGRGDATAFALPTDNQGNTSQQLGATHRYTRWADSGTAMYTFTSAAGRHDHTIRTTTTPDDEITLFALEVIEGTTIQAYAWNEVTSGPLTSEAVTTTGPATLIAFWWGDAFVMVDQTATPDSGFTVVDAVLAPGSLVQGAVAVKNVTAAGTYRVTWTATPAQGAQLWLIAVQ